jgi:phage shock protein A
MIGSASLEGGVMRKALVLFAVVVLVVGIAACKKGEKAADQTPDKPAGKYAEVIPVVEKFVAANEEFIADLDKVTKAEELAAALNKATERMKDLAPKMKEIGDKYPEFEQMENPPEELKPVMDKLTGLMEKLMGSMMKAAPFMEDPKVKEAQAAYQAVMDTMK